MVTIGCISWNLIGLVGRLNDKWNIKISGLGPTQSRTLLKYHNFQSAALELSSLTGSQKIVSEP